MHSLIYEEQKAASKLFGYVDKLEEKLLNKVYFQLVLRKEISSVFLRENGN